MRRKLSDTVTVITGASSGIGRATARALAVHGGAVVLTARDTAALERVAGDCRDAGAEVLVASLDVTDAQAVEDLARRVVGQFGRIDAWVNNAGVILYGRAEEVPDDLWRRVVDTNLFGVYHGVRAALPWFREQGGGVLVNVSSVLGKAGAPYQSAYVASKHAVRALGDCVRQEVADLDGVQVSTVLPGPVDTPLFGNAANLTGRRVVPPGPTVDPERVAAAIVRCIRRPRREVVVGGSTRLGLLANRVAPALSEALLARAVARSNFDDVPTARTAGNLLAPRPDATATTGSWRPERGGRARRRVAVAAAAVGLGAVVAGVRR